MTNTEAGKSTRARDARASGEILGNDVLSRPTLSDPDRERRSQITTRTAHSMARILQPSDMTILIVDDDPEIRELVRDYLEDFGYRVLIAASGSEAIEIAAAQNPLQLMITDIRMPEMSGIELADYVARERGDVKIIFMSGFTAQHAPMRRLLRKPFRLADLEQAVRTELSM